MSRNIDDLSNVLINVTIGIEAVATKDGRDLTAAQRSRLKRIRDEVQAYTAKLVADTRADPGIITVDSAHRERVVQGGTIISDEHVTVHTTHEHKGDHDTGTKH